ncbi:MAG: hypothetical protein MHM6MM_002055 [Cercozoa sp. M6MM]
MSELDELDSLLDEHAVVSGVDEEPEAPPRKKAKQQTLFGDTLSTKKADSMDAQGGQTGNANNESTVVPSANLDHFEDDGFVEDDTGDVQMPTKRRGHKRSRRVFDASGQALKASDSCVLNVAASHSTSHEARPGEATLFDWNAHGRLFRLPSKGAGIVVAATVQDRRQWRLLEERGAPTVCAALSETCAARLASDGTLHMRVFSEHLLQQYCCDRGDWKRVLPLPSSDMTGALLAVGTRFVVVAAQTQLLVLCAATGVTLKHWVTPEAVLSLRAVDDRFALVFESGMTKLYCVRNFVSESCSASLRLGTVGNLCRRLRWLGFHSPSGCLLAHVTTHLASDYDDTAEYDECEAETLVALVLSNSLQCDRAGAMSSLRNSTMQWQEISDMRFANLADESLPKKARFWPVEARDDNVICHVASDNTERVPTRVATASGHRLPPVTALPFAMSPLARSALPLCTASASKSLLESAEAEQHELWLQTVMLALFSTGEALAAPGSEKRAQCAQRSSQARIAIDKQRLLLMRCACEAEASAAAASLVRSSLAPAARAETLLERFNVIATHFGRTKVSALIEELQGELAFATEDSNSDSESSEDDAEDQSAGAHSSLTSSQQAKQAQQPLFKSSVTASASKARRKANPFARATPKKSASRSLFSSVK